MNIERAQEIKNSELWGEVERELGVMKQMEIVKLMTCKPEEVIRLQARIEILEFIKNLPQIVIDREA